MKMNLLEIVQDILNDTNGEGVNSIGDTEEATQIANRCRSVYFEMITSDVIPSLQSFIALPSYSSADTPTHFHIPETVSNIHKVWYQDVEGKYRKVDYSGLSDFYEAQDSLGSDYIVVNDPVTSTQLRVGRFTDPTCWTDIGGGALVMDSFDSFTEAHLTTTKIRALVTKRPVFLIQDSFTPELDEVFFPAFLNECKSRTMSLDFQTIDPHIERAAKRSRVHLQKHKNMQPNQTKPLSTYGR